MELKKISRLGMPAWYFGAVFLFALVAQLLPTWREHLIYERAAVGGGEFWRIWTGHAVHFGWPHFVADGGLLLIIGWTLGREFPRTSWLGLLLMPPFISAVIYFLDPEMTRYAGLSALNLGLLLLLAARGWKGDLRDWFWPAIVVIYVVELSYEIWKGGQGGGFITFDEPGVKVATSAHLGAVAYALAAWAWCAWRSGVSPDREAAPPS
ncbi:MAG: rhombosortase [Opitutus sp.]|nr:rhombosortase [Opitutus sp.]